MDKLWKDDCIKAISRILQVCEAYKECTPSSEGIQKLDLGICDSLCKERLQGERYAQNLPTRELEIATTLECVAVEINLSPEKTLLLINCYRPPSDQEFFHDFKDVIANFRLDKYWSALIVGDFNYPGINWIDGSGFTNSTSSEEQQFADFIMDHYFYQLVDKPTRVNNMSSKMQISTP